MPTKSPPDMGYWAKPIAGAGSPLPPLAHRAIGEALRAVFALPSLHVGILGIGDVLQLMKDGLEERVTAEPPFQVDPDGALAVIGHPRVFVWLADDPIHFTDPRRHPEPQRARERHRVGEDSLLPGRGAHDLVEGERIAHARANRSEEHTSELQSRLHLVCRLL